MMKRIALSLMFLFGAGSAAAVDGVLEINQRCVATGCFAGDSAGFPVQLASNGSYRLTSNLTVLDENTTAIRATADLVTVDLNGFTIIGPVNCSGRPVTSCNLPVGTGIGVELNASGNYSGSTVKNGLIQGMGNAGVKCTNCSVINVSSRSNRLVGINQFDGIISGSSAIANGTIGIVGSGTIESSIAEDNRLAGFESRHALIRGSTARNNGGIGFDCRFQHCTALDNVSHNNDGFGFRFSDDAATTRSSFGRNSSYDNTSGAVAGNALQLDKNRCDNALCP